jgi:hypothetical protein
VLVSALAVLLGSCQETDPLPGSGMIDGMDLGLELGLDLAELAAAAAQADPALLERIATKTGYDSAQPPVLYTAHTLLGEEEVELRIVMLPLAMGGRLVIATDSTGHVRATGLFGTSTFEPDTDGAWETFCFQFRNGAAPMTLAETMGPAQVDQYWATLQGDPAAEAEALRALYRHRVLMAANSQYVRATMRRTARGDLPPRDFVRQWRLNFLAVSELSSTLSGFFGEKAAEHHHRLALDAAERLDSLLLTADTQEPRDVRKLVSGDLYRDTCKACHEIKSDRLAGDDLYDGMRRRLGEFGVRRDVLRVGWDLWGVPGDEEHAQDVADAFKAGFLLLGEVPPA